MPRLRAAGQRDPSSTVWELVDERASAGQRRDVHNIVDEIERLISRSFCLETVIPASRSVTPPSPGAARGRPMNSVRRSRVLEIEVRGLLPTHRMRPLYPGRSDCASFGVAFG